MPNGGTKSAVDWKEIMNNPAVTQVTTMGLPNQFPKHTAKTSERLLNNMRARAGRLKHLLNLSMAEVNGGK